MLNPGSIIVLLLVLFQSIRCKDMLQFSTFLFLDAIAFALLVNSGYFIKIGSIELQYEEFLMLLYLFISFLLIGSIKVNLATFTNGLLLLTVTLFGIYLLVIHPDQQSMVVPIGASWDAMFFGENVMRPLSFSTNNLERVIRIVLFVFLGTIARDISVSHENLISRAILFITTVQMVIGFIDFFTKIVLNIPVLPVVSARIFGVGSSQYSALAFRGGIPSIQGFMKEASHFACSFFPGLTYLALTWNKTRKMVIVEFLSVLILFLSGSFTGFAIILYWGVLHVYKFIVSSRLGKLPSLIISAGTLFLVFEVVQMLSEEFPILQYYISRAYSVLGIGSSVGSEPIRLMSITYSIDLFMKYPLFGIGIGSSIAHGFIPNLLSNIGIIGFLTWLSFSFNAFLITFKVNYIPIVSIFLLFMCFIGDIGWAYNMMGISMLLGLNIGMNGMDTMRKNKASTAHTTLIDKEA